MALGDDESNPDQDEEWTNLHEQLREAIEQAEDQDSWQEIGNGSLLAVFEVCEAGSADDLAELLNEHEQLDLNMPGPDGDTALHIACLYGHMDCVKLLFEKGAEATVLNEEDGSTTLHDAAAGGYLDICKLILEKGGAELVKIADEDGDTPLHNAARGNHTDVVALLLASGADPKALNKEGNTPAQEAEEDAVIQLLEKAASP